MGHDQSVMPVTEPAGAEPLVESANRALAEGRWPDARASFERALEIEESGEALEGLGWVGWWVADEELTMTSRERAHDRYLEEGDKPGAARVAAWLAGDYSEYRGEEILARGWLQRAHRLLDDHETVEEHGWLALIDASFALHTDCDLEVVLPAARRGAEIGREFDVPDLVSIGLAYEGMALTGLGSVEEGLRKIDESASITALEEMTLPVSPAWAYCCMLSACDGMGDLARGLQYCQAMRDFASRWGGRQLNGICRTSYGRILTTGGDWQEAESELMAAVEDLTQARPGMAPSGLYRLGELRLRQGRIEEARELFEQAGTYGLIGIGELHLGDGEYQEAADTANRVLRNCPNAPFADRLPALELLVRASIELGDLETAQKTCDAIGASAEACGTPYVAGRAALVRAELLLAESAVDEARIAAEDAIDRFNESSAPYDRARAELRLALVLDALGRESRAVELVGLARSMFETLGAARDLEACEKALQRTAAAERESPSVGDLTARELEVLRLVAQGKSDAEIADELVLSPHTVHRHVANIRTKLRLSSRSAAVAWATRQNLL